MKVLKIEKDKKKRDVFNMEVEDVHSFVVNNGIVAHNCFDATKYFLMMSPLPVSVEERPRIKGYSPFN